MAGEYIRVQRAIWEDDDFRELSMPAQWLYFRLLTSDGPLTGVRDWRPNRIAPSAQALTADVIESAAGELGDTLFVIFDPTTEEALIRSFVRHDGLLKQPNMGVAVAKDYAKIASRTLRGVFVFEMQRLFQEQPQLRGWEPLQVLLKKTAIDPSGTPT